MYGLQKQTQSLQELNPEKESWNIVARVVWLWFVEDYTKRKISIFHGDCSSRQRGTTQCTLFSYFSLLF